MTALQDIAQEADAFWPARWFEPSGLKGAIYATSDDDSNEKRTVGALWERKMAGKGVFLMAEKILRGKGVRAQLVEHFGS